MTAFMMPSFDAGEFIGLVAVAGWMLIGLVGIVAGCWVAVRRAETAAALKHDMLNRGMSADEIVAVMNAGKDQSRKSCRRSCV
jgi:hypothetical protein